MPSPARCTGTSLRFACLASAALLLGAAMPVRAAVHCVGDGSELQSALTAAAASAEDDEIRLRAGTFVASQTFLYLSTNPGWLLMTGGYGTLNANPCGQRSGNAGATVLDGQGQRQALLVSFQPQSTPAGFSRFALENMSIVNGMASGFVRGGGVAMFSSSDSFVELWLDNVIVSGSTGYFGGGADLYSARGLIRVANSLFADNAAPTSAFGHLSALVGATDAGSGHGVIISNSTFVNGTCANQGGRSCGIGLMLSPGIHGDVINSLFWNNAFGDVNIEGGGVANFDYSRIGTVTGNVTPTITNAVAGDPGFVDAPSGNFRLRNDSAMIDRGFGVPAFYGFRSIDLDGNPRVQSGALDLGAYENQWLFGDGFE